MKLEGITLKLEKIVQSPYNQFVNMKPQVEVRVTLEQGDDVGKVRKHVQDLVFTELAEIEARCIQQLNWDGRQEATRSYPNSTPQQTAATVHHPPPPSQQQVQQANPMGALFGQQQPQPAQPPNLYANYNPDGTVNQQNHQIASQPPEQPPVQSYAPETQGISEEAEMISSVGVPGGGDSGQTGMASQPPPYPGR